MSTAATSLRYQRIAAVGVAVIALALNSCGTNVDEVAPVASTAVAGGSATNHDADLIVLPGLGRLSWRCDSRRRFSTTFHGARPLTTQRVAVQADGRRLASATLGQRHRRLATPFGEYKTQAWRIVQRTQPATVRATISVVFRVLPEPTRDCLVPELRATVRTQSHTVGG